jgi:peptidoglycan/LPS O-acetylase OafA/YrhL
MSSVASIHSALQEVPVHEGIKDPSKSSQKSTHNELYIPVLDGMRAIAFLLVFVAHAGLYYVVPGGFGVTVFFFLSGYLITTLLRAEAVRTETISLRKFYLRRALRILPPMYITLGIAYAIGTTGLLPMAGNLFGFLSVSGYFFNYADLLHHNAVALPSGTGVLWSLMVEEHFYLIFPFVYLLFLRRKVSVKKQVNILLGVCLAVLFWRLALVNIFHTPTASETYPRWTYSASEARFDAILFGCILAIRNNYSLGDSSPLLSRYKGLLALGGLGLMAIAFGIREPHFRETFRYTIVCIALYPIFYYCIASTSEWQTRWLAWKSLRFLGWISYSMYLFHYVLLEISNKRYPNHPVITATVSFCLAVGYSWLMRLGIELPIKRWRSSLERRLFVTA